LKKISHSRKERNIKRLSTGKLLPHFGSRKKGLYKKKLAK